MLYKLLLLLLGIHLCPADNSKIIRPCKLHDHKCIGDNLAANSNCKIIENGFLPTKYIMPTFHYDTPFFNASYIDHNLIIRNLNLCFISEFFFNVETNGAVMTIDCPSLDLESDRTLIQHRTFQEDSYYYYHIRGVYPLIRITINFKSVTRRDLCSASIFTDVTALPKLQIVPKNKPTANYLTKDLSDLYIYERENCHARGPALAYKFIDSSICDYGCSMPK